MAVGLKPECASESSAGLVKTQISGSHCTESWGPRSHHDSREGKVMCPALNVKHHIMQIAFPVIGGDV